MGKVKNCIVVEKSIPALRIALTPKCNLSCEYCPPKGENFITVENPLSAKRLLNILNIFYTKKGYITSFLPVMGG